MIAVKKSYTKGSGAVASGVQSAPNRGFTIIEVTIAAVVMALAISTSIVAMQRAFLALDSARNTTLAGQIMQSEIEKMRLNDWTTVSGYGSGPTTLTIPASFTGGSSTIASRFTLTRSVAPHALSDIKIVTLAIAWRSYDGRAQSRSYSTYYGKNGLYDFFYNSY